MPVGKFFYIVRENEKGEGIVEFYADAESARTAREIEEKAGRWFLPPAAIELEFDNTGKLLTPDLTLKELQDKLKATVPGSPTVQKAVEVEEETTAAEFDRAAAPQAPAAPTVNDPTAGITSLEGKTVAFAGKIVTMSRIRIKELATDLGVNIASFVTEKTDLVVEGEEGGLKLERAREYGIPVISEKQWNKLVERVGGNISRSRRQPDAPAQG